MSWNLIIVGASLIPGNFIAGLRRQLLYEFIVHKEITADDGGRSSRKMKGDGLFGI